MKLIDYGVSCRLGANENGFGNHELGASSSEGKRHTAVGTPYWMAPEVIMCDGQQLMEYDARCDVW